MVYPNQSLDTCTGIVIYHTSQNSTKMDLNSPKVFKIYIGKMAELSLINKAVILSLNSPKVFFKYIGEMTELCTYNQLTSKLVLGRFFEIFCTISVFHSW
jgi:hypothetical protein